MESWSDDEFMNAFFCFLLLKFFYLASFFMVRIGGAFLRVVVKRWLKFGVPWIRVFVFACSLLGRVMCF